MGSQHCNTDGRSVLKNSYGHNIRRVYIGHPMNFSADPRMRFCVSQICVYMVYIVWITR